MLHPPRVQFTASRTQDVMIPELLERKVQQKNSYSTITQQVLSSSRQILCTKTNSNIVCYFSRDSLDMLVQYFWETEELKELVFLHGRYLQKKHYFISFIL